MGEMKTEPRILGTILGTKTRNEDIKDKRRAIYSILYFMEDRIKMQGEACPRSQKF